MKSFFEELNKEKIIDSQDIAALKNYINGTYPHLDSAAKSNLLAKSIHSILDMHLKEFNTTHKAKIKINLIKNVLSKNIDTLNKSDIVNTIVNLNDTSDGLLKDLIAWVNTSSNHKINIHSLKRYLANQNIKEISSLEKVSPESSTVSVMPEENNSLASNNYILLVNNMLSSIKLNINSYLQKYLLNVFQKKKLAKYAGIFSISFFLIVLPFSNTIVNGVDMFNPFNAKNRNIETEISYENINLERIRENSRVPFRNNHIPPFLKYKKFNTLKLKLYLRNKNSLLSEEPYFYSIINSAGKFNLNPLILFAIAGHEQAFVPTDHPQAKIIANNPFNVFGSWEKYNTDIIDSSEIAARTVSNLLRNRENSVDPFKWINRKYAQDENWWKGVRSIFYDLEEIVR